MEMAYTELNAKLCAFLDKTPNSFFAVKNIKVELAAAGFTELQENSRWQLQEGGKYYVSRNGSALLAFVLPQKDYLGFQVYACHCDSPAFKLKNNAEIVVDKKYVKLNVEKYGGMLLNNDAGPTATPDPDGDEISGYFPFDGFQDSHLEVFVTPTPEPDSAAMEP